MSGAIIHEWVEADGGAERVIDTLAALIPDAPIFCLWNDAHDRYEGRTVEESFLARTPLRGHKAMALPLMPLVWRHFPRSDADWAIISSHLFAHHALNDERFAGVQKFIYVHTPARYLWAPELDLRGNAFAARIAVPLLRRIDRMARHSNASFAANSSFVAQRVTRAWGRPAMVIHPPVEVDRISAEPEWVDQLSAEELSVVESLPPNFILGASRLVGYKRLEDVIRAGELCDTPVVIAGNGPDRARLTAVAEASSVPVIFLGRVSDALLYSLYQLSEVYVFPPIEDFGIMPVEAMAAGGRVVVNRVGGAAESVLDGLTGSHCDFNDPLDVRTALEKATGTSVSAAIERAAVFSAQAFSRKVVSWIGADKIDMGQVAQRGDLGWSSH